MGGGGSQTVGYKYYLGVHMVLCHGPIDLVREIRVDDKTAWEGFSDGETTLYLNQPGLFGGDDREGGISGYVDIDMGAPDQVQNAYLQSKLGNDIPAYRGVTSAILRQCYMGNNPYLKSWSFRGQRINTSTNGEEQWYIEKAPIGSTNNVAIYIAMDISNSMEIDGRLNTLKTGLNNALAPLLGLPGNSTIDMRVVGFAAGTVAIERENIGGDDVSDIRDWILARDFTDVINGTTDYSAAIDSATAFFNSSDKTEKVLLFITDGEATGGSELAASATFQTLEATYDTNFKGYAINIELSDTSHTGLLDNTPEDSIPIVPSEDTSVMESTITNVIFSIFDMNPAHIIRECLTDTEWGMGYLANDIDNTSFEAAADTLYNENMGMSLLWSRQIPIEDFIKEVVRHINAALYIDRLSGKYVLKLIRDDYLVENLITLNEGNIRTVSNYQRTDPGEAVNSVTVVYWDTITGANASLTADDVALIQQHGYVINTTIQYPGFTNGLIAGKAAARDLQTLSAPLLNVTIEANREASSLNIGDVFKFEWPDYHDGYVVMRVHQVALGDGKTNRVKLTCTEDVFYLPTTPVLGIEEPGWEELGGPPVAPLIQSAFESPYYELAQTLGQSALDNLIEQTPEIGYIAVYATRPENGLNANVWYDDGSGYSENTGMDFSPHCKLGADVGRLDTNWTFTDGENLSFVTVGQHGQIGNELFRVDAIDTDAGTLTVGRALLDTIPEEHSQDDPIVFWDDLNGAITEEFVDSESIDVKVLTNSSQGALDLADGVVSTVVMNSRAVRPYRPAALAVAGNLDPSISDYPAYPVDITWNERNRLNETGGVFLDWEDASVTPEVGTEYYIVVESLDESYVSQGTITTATQTATTFQITEAMIGATYSVNPFVKVTVTTQRDGYDSWTSPSLIFRGPFRAPDELAAIYVPEIVPTVKVKILP